LRNIKTDVADVTARLFGQSMGIFSMRLGSKDYDPSGPDWFDLKIEPLLRNPPVYLVAIVYRNSEIKAVLDTAERTEERLGQIIDSIENGKARDNPDKLLVPTTSKSTAPKKSK